MLSEKDVAALRPRDAVVQALKARGVKLASTRKTVPQLKELLNDAEAPRRTAGRSPAPAAGEPPVANGAQDKAVHKEAINAFKAAFHRSGRTTLTSDEMLANVRSVLNGSEGRPLPQSKGALDNVARSLRAVREARASADDSVLAGKIHPCVSECLRHDDAGIVDLQLMALNAEIETRLFRLKEMSKAPKEGSADVKGADPVLEALGEAGRWRLLWAYYVAYCKKVPAFGKSPCMSFRAGSYIGQLYAILYANMDSPLRDSVKHMKSAKTLRDFLSDWCFFWSHSRPPFVHVGPRAEWTKLALPLLHRPRQDCRLPQCRQISGSEHHLRSAPSPRAPPPLLPYPPGPRLAPPREIGVGPVGA